MTDRFRITSLQPDKCSVYAEGERCVLDLPRVVKDQSDGLCVYLLNAFMAELAKRPDASLEEPFDFVCTPSGMPCGGRFRAEAITGPAGALSAAAAGAVNTTARASYMKVLLRNPFFGPLPIPSLAQIAARLEYRQFQPGENILTAGQPGRHFHLVLSGQCEVIETDKEENEKVLATLSADHCFGEMSLLTGEPVSATVKAKDAVATVHLSKDQFDQILDKNPSLTRHFLKLLASRLRQTNHQMLEELEKGVTGKLSMITLPELSQAISASGRTGTLHLYWRDKRGVVVFSNGQIFDARVPPVEGEEAFYQMMNWTDGNFKFSQGEIATTRDQPMDTMGLLMEGMRRQDEMKQSGGTRKF